MQLQSNDFPISYRFKISDFNKHLLHFMSNENFSQPAGVLLSNSTAHDIIYILMTLTYVPLYFLFFSIFLLFCFSRYFSIFQIKENYFKVNITKTEISLFHLSLVELSVVLSSNVLPSLWKFLFFSLLCSFMLSPLSRCLIYLCVILEWEK